MVVNRYVPPHRRRRQAQDEGDNELETLFCNAFDRICCINLEQRPDKWRNFQRQARRVGTRFQEKVERFDAMDGNRALDKMRQDDSSLYSDEISLEWDTSQNALWDRHVKPGVVRTMTRGEVGCALSHVALWKQLAMSSDSDPTNSSEKSNTMLILEDDVEFYSGDTNQRQFSWRKPAAAFEETKRHSSSHRFLEAFSKIWSALPDDWGILYLGFSDRGDRIPVPMDETNQETPSPSTRSRSASLDVKLFCPTYGFQTHAYAIRHQAAVTLVDNLPVVGPVDVWLADHQWFGLKVYCGVIANEGWNQTGAWLVRQCKTSGSDVAQSGRNSNHCRSNEETT